VWICESALLTGRKTIFVSGGLELRVKISSLQMESNTMYLSVLSGLAVPRLSRYLYKVRPGGGGGEERAITFVSLWGPSWRFE
jgi:hypothetical protein